MAIRSTLKGYLIKVFVPLTGLPLLVLAGLTYALTSRSFDDELLRRSRPELDAVARSLETVERRLAQQLARLGRSEELHSALASGESAPLSSQLESWLESSLFDRVRFYRADGSPGARAARGSRSSLKAWESLFAPSERGDRRKPASAEESRGPASAAFSLPAERFEGAEGSSLRSDFRRYLRTEDGLVARRLVGEGPSGEPGGLVWSVYKAVVDTEFRVVGYLEGEVPLEAGRLRILAGYHGLELVLMAPDLSWTLASSPSVTAAFRSWLPAWLASRSREDGAASRPGDALLNRPADLLIQDEPMAFFFAALAPSADEGGWVGIGLSRADQLQLRNQILLWVLAMAAALAAIVVFLTVSISNRLTAPISALVEAAERVRQGEWVHPVTVNSNTELGFLASRFNEMALSVQVTKRTLESKLEELATAHDAITQTQAQLVQSAKMSSLGQLVAGVAHELNNPIAFIYSNMSQMKTYLRDLARLDAAIREAREKLEPAARAELDRELEAIEWETVRKDFADIVQSCLEGSIRVKDIVLGLRNFSRADKGDSTEMDLRQALENTVKLLSAQIKNRVEIQWDVQGPTHLQCNNAQVNQVLMNLLANALQAIEGKGQVWIRIRSEEREGRVCRSISIRDTGRGIAPEHIDRIFDPFFTTKKVGEGTGLGLSIVYGIVERHQGTIEVTSRLGEGTEFIVRLPAEGPRSMTADLDEAS